MALLGCGIADQEADGPAHITRQASVLLPTPSGSEPVTAYQGEQLPPAPVLTWDQTSYVAHEWGTFTSVQSSAGETMQGLHHEEEPLPGFVHSRGLGVYSKLGEALPEAVTQKMETPVVFLYSPQPKTVSLTVDFPQGIISQYYPDCSAMQPKLYGADALADGSMTWTVDLHPNLLNVPAPYVDPADIWSPSRRVASTPLSYDDEYENFVFYRGVGRFTVPMTITSVSSDGTDTLTISNGSEQRIPAAFLIRVTSEGGAVHELGRLPANGKIQVVAPTRLDDMDTYLAKAEDRIANALRWSGLYGDEAVSMVKTWTHSYFHTPGLRVLYVLPDEWTNDLLPMRVRPAPTEIKRTLVGRIEVLTPAEEATVVALINDSHKGESTYKMPPELAVDRFAEAKVHRALQLITEPDLKAYAGHLLKMLGPVFLY